MLNRYKTCKFVAALGVCGLAAFAVLRFGGTRDKPAVGTAARQPGPRVVPKEAPLPRKRASAGTTGSASAGRHALPWGRVRPASMTKLKHPEDLESVTNAAAAFLGEVNKLLDGRYGQIGGWNKRYFLNVTDREQNVEFNCTFFTPTGGLKQVDRVALGPSRDHSMMAFYTNGGIKVFDYAHHAAGVGFYEDGTPEYLYSRLPDGREYSVDWDKAGDVSHEMVH
jgi:hypothetical protein